MDADFAVQVHGSGLVAVNDQPVRSPVLHQVGKLLVAAIFVLADEGRNLQSADFFHQKHVQKSVLGVRLRHGVEAAAVEPTVAGTDEGQLGVENLPVHFHHVVLGDALDDVHHRRSGVGPESLQKGQALIARHVGAHPGVQTHGANIQGIVLVAPD